MSERLYLLGHPIAHSKSPVLYNELYRRLNLDWLYSLKDCETAEEARDFITASEFLSINITTPYKTLAFEKASIVHPCALLAQGANLVINKDKTLSAYNVDGSGCVSFLKLKGFSFMGSSVVVCGTGPTALAILHASVEAGAERLVLLGRNKKRTKTVLEGYLSRYRSLLNDTRSLSQSDSIVRLLKDSYENAEFAAETYSDAKEILRGSDLIIDATPVGMKEGEPALFETTLLHEGQTVLDVVYGHGETTLVHDAKAQGSNAYDGKGMLVSQAVETVRIIFDVIGATLDMSDDEMFSIMVKASGFEC